MHCHLRSMYRPCSRLVTAFHTAAPTMRGKPTAMKTSYYHQAAGFVFVKAVNGVAAAEPSTLMNSVS